MHAAARGCSCLALACFGCLAELPELLTVVQVNIQAGASRQCLLAAWSQLESCRWTRLPSVLGDSMLAASGKTVGTESDVRPAERSVTSLHMGHDQCERRPDSLTGGFPSLSHCFTFMVCRALMHSLCAGHYVRNDHLAPRSTRGTLACCGWT